jgi:glucans biosynthesis protein
VVKHDHAFMTAANISRRAALAAGGAFFCAPLLARTTAAGNAAFSWDWLRAYALDLARKPYVAPPKPTAAAQAVTYDALNHISYRGDHTLWGKNGTPGVRFFPLNHAANVPVPISVVENGRARDFAFSRSQFSGVEHLPAGVEGFSGFRLMNPKGESDWLAFQGASYFRAAGPLDQYGLSARGLAIDTGLQRPEEFPRFSHFWLEQGADGALIVYALLDSPSVAGAWRFVNRLTPQGVVQEVSLTMQFRNGVERLGIAPLTSMYWYGEGERDKAIDWRPEIHDSDGLALLTGTGERIWRPIVNPPKPITSSFVDNNPRGFGLLQRDRNFDHYQDDGVFYEKRPSLWVEPVGDWGPGAVGLFALPTHKETDDNIVAFWTPKAPVKAGSRYTLDYRLHWIATEPGSLTLARTVDCWRGVAGRPGHDPVAGATRLVADFAGDSLAGLTRDSGVTADVSLSRGKPISVAAYPVVGAPGRWRLIVDIAQPGDEPVDLRACLRRGDAALTETLLYQFL